MLPKMIVVLREDQGEEQRVCKGGTKWEEYIIATKKQEKRQRGKTKQQNKDEQICQSRQEIAEKKSDKKIAKKSAKYHQRAQKEHETQKLNAQKPLKHRKRRHDGKKSTEDEEVKPTRICKTSTTVKMSDLVQNKQ